MSTLNIIGEFFQNWESQTNFAAARDLTLALAETAPRGHASSLLIASDTVPPQIDHVKSSVAKIPLRSSMLPIMWHSSQAARPLDGEYLHALTPLAPLRTREDYDGSQTSVMIPHTLAWDAPETLVKSQARQLRSFTRRAIKHANAIVTPTHAVADKLQDIYGDAIQPYVLPLTAPRELLADANAEQKRAELNLPAQYLLTMSALGEAGRLEWVINAIKNNPELPHLVLINYEENFTVPNWDGLKERLTILKPQNLSDVGAALNGATALVLPQKHSDALFLAYGALAQGIPIVHGGNKAIVEIALESGTGDDNENVFTQALLDITASEDERRRLSILAKDRSRSFSWQQTAWQLWEIHANI